MFLLSNITWSETATYEYNEINTWVSIYQSLSLWLVTGAAFLTFCPAGPDDSGPRGSSGHLHNQGGSTWRNSVCLVQSSLDTPQTESLPTRQEGQVGTSQDSHPQAVLLYCWPWCRIAILSPGGIHDHNKNGRETGNSPSQLCWSQSGLESRGAGPGLQSEDHQHQPTCKAPGNPAGQSASGAARSLPSPERRLALPPGGGVRLHLDPVKKKKKKKKCLSGG